MGILEREHLPGANLIPSLLSLSWSVPNPPRFSPWCFPHFRPSPHHFISSLSPLSHYRFRFSAQTSGETPACCACRAACPGFSGPALLLPRGWGVGGRVC